MIGIERCISAPDSRVKGRSFVSMEVHNTNINTRMMAGWPVCILGCARWAGDNINTLPYRVKLWVKLVGLLKYRIKFYECYTKFNHINQ